MSQPPKELRHSCPGCGQPIAYLESKADAEISCPHCGQATLLPALPQERLVRLRHCPNCAKFIAQSATVCPTCGYHQEDTTPRKSPLKRWLELVSKGAPKETVDRPSMAYRLLIVGLVLLPLAMGFFALYMALKVVRILEME